MVKLTDEQKLELIDITNKTQWDRTLVLCKLIYEDWYLKKGKYNIGYILSFSNEDIQIIFNEEIIAKLHILN